MKPRVLVTGPARGVEDWLAAARRAGWEPLHVPLVAVEPLPDVDLSRAVARRPDWICVTSSSVLFALEPCRAAWSDVPCAVVGRRSAERLRDLGFRVALAGARTAAELAAALVPRLSPGSLVLWPSGEQAGGLGMRLSAAGAAVSAPVVYATRARAPADFPPAAALFLASPSAARALAGRQHVLPAHLLAIGASTLRAVRELGLVPPESLHLLEAPEPAALEAGLLALAR